MRSAVVVLILLQFLLGRAAEASWNMSIDQALAVAEQKKLAQTRQWILFNHFEHNLFGIFKSQITDPSFFQSPVGNVNPEEELKSLLQALWQKPLEKDFNEHPRCRFPARLKWLQKEIGLVETPDKDTEKILAGCELYRRFIQVLGAQSVSFVFSSYYTNNPGSAFGHTLFRIEKKTAPGFPKSELLDHGIGYAAQVTTDNPVAYALFGIVGLFKGNFTNLPYYYKVREYNDFEARDLWSYELALTPEEIQVLQDHLWEIGNSYFDYYFFTQNCAYHMLSVLEAAAPRLKVVERVPLYVIPSDSIKAIHQEPGLVRSVQYRPSIRAVFRHRFNALSEADQALFIQYSKTLDPEVFTAVKESARYRDLLDAGIDYLDMAFPKNSIEPKSEGALKKEVLLQRRAALQEISPLLHLPLPENERPELGHGSSRWGIGYGKNELDHGLLDLEFRFALHDELDSSIGYPRHSVIEFFHFRGEVDTTTNRGKVTDFDFFQAASNNPLGPFEKKLSWRGRLGTHDFKNLVCDTDCVAPGLRFGGGYSFYLDKAERWMPYLFVDTSVFYDVRFLDKPYMLSAGPTVGLWMSPLERWKANVEFGYQAQVVHSQQDLRYLQVETRYHFSKFLQGAIRYSKEWNADRLIGLAYYSF